jgi:hypothetical protein
MSGIITSAAFQEFIQKRCEEIVLHDSVYNQTNKEILVLESQMRKLMSGELSEKFNKYEGMVSNLSDYVETLLYSQGWSDFK